MSGKAQVGATYKKIPIEIKAIKTGAIIVGAGILGDLRDIFSFNEYSSLVLVTDTITGKLYGPKVNESLKETGRKVLILTVPVGERSKSLKEADHGYKVLLDNNVDRKALLCVLGGGVVGDLGGYIASTYLRGIDYVQLPTTLLAQVDSSIGGKVGVNFGGKKNMVGSFYQPRVIISDVTLLQSLPATEMKNGITEVIKYGLAMDERLFHNLAERGKWDFATPQLIDIVERCARLKAKVVEEDETERSGWRAILNFGHTIGHAIEAVADLQGQHHGEAVAIGMMAEARISERIGMLDKKNLQKIEEILTQFNLPTYCQKMSPDALLEATRFDKKTTHEQTKWVLLKGIGQGVINCTVEDDVVKEVLKEVCR
ncbi:3-dehydroquinate synthase [Chloroflexota bacterium]